MKFIMRSPDAPPPAQVIRSRSNTHTAVVTTTSGWSSITEDGLAYTLTLREGLAWHDGEAEELLVDGDHVRGERPRPAEVAELEDGPTPGTHLAEGGCEAANTCGIDGLGAVGEADGEPPRRAERERGRREAARPRDRDDKRLVGGLGGEAPDERREIVLVQPSLLDERARPLHVADGQGGAAGPCHDDRARGGTPLRGTLPRGLPRAARVAERAQRLALPRGRIGERARDELVDDPVPGEVPEHPAAVRGLGPSGLLDGLARVLRHGHGARTGPVEHRGGARPGVFVRAGGEVPRRMREEERDGIEDHGWGTTAGTGGLAAS